MEKFEGHIVGYVLNTAAMPFFRTGCYPHYRNENGYMVVDNGDDSKELKAQALAGYDLIRKIQKKYKAGQRIPKKWIEQLKTHITLVDALKQCHVIVDEWYEQFHRAVRYLDQLPK